MIFDALLARDDSRLITRRWIQQRFAPGATISEIAPDGGVVFIPYKGVPYPLSLELRRNGPHPDIVIVQSSPLRPPLDDIAEVQAVLNEDYRLAFVQHGVNHDPGNVYDLQDEFFLPLAGFQGIERPGPNLDVYVRNGIWRRW